MKNRRRSGTINDVFRKKFFCRCETDVNVDIHTC